MLAHERVVQALPRLSALTLLLAGALGAGCGDESRRAVGPLLVEAPLALPAGTASAAAAEVAAADLDGDGDMDLVIADGAAVVALLNDGAGRFAHAAPITLSGIGPIAATRIVDLDGDGFPDLVVADRGSLASTAIRATPPPTALDRDTEITDASALPTSLAGSPLLTTLRTGFVSDGLLELDLAAIPAAPRIESATLTLTVFSPITGLPTPPPIEPIGVFRNLKAFPIPVGFTAWYAAPPGNPALPEALFQIAKDAAAGTALTFDLGALVADWTSGAQPNFGVLVRREPPLASGGLRLASSNAPQVAQRPLLTVEHETVRHLVVRNAGLDPNGAWLGFVDPAAASRVPVPAAFRETVAPLVADLDGDALPDVYLPGAGTCPAALHNVTVVGAPGVPTGTAAFAEVVPCGAIEHARAAARADLDGDGLDDLLIGTATGLRALVNHGGLSFADESATRLPALGADPVDAVLVLDIDQDGGLFEVLLLAGARDARLLRWDGAGALTDATTDLDAAARAVRGVAGGAGDLDGDGRLDVVVVHPTDGARILAGTAQGGLVGHGGVDLAAPALAGPLGVAIADLDGDGRSDVVIVGQGGAQILLRR